MPVSAARLLANRRNALKSSGPRTDEGKSISRRNSLKHGLTGDGVVLPLEDLNKLNQRFETLKTELQPSGEAGRIFLRRFAYLSIRLEKCEEFDTSATASRVRHAVEIFDDNRLTDVETLASGLAVDPMTMARRLQNSPEGIDWLKNHWGELREDLLNRDRAAWTLNHWTRVEQLLGRPGGNFRMTRPYALTQALSGHFVYLNQSDGEGLADPERIEWARTELEALIDAELARLEIAKAHLNPELIQRDRLEAPSRALFDASPALNLARRYEAATERAMYKALDQFHEVELAALEVEPIAANQVAEMDSDRLGSLCSEASEVEEAVTEPVESVPVSVFLGEPVVKSGRARKIQAVKRPRKNRDRRNQPVMS